MTASHPMPRFIAFLRAVNVGGRTVTMEKLRALFEALGFEGVETFIASGNVIFRSQSEDTAALRRTIEGRLREALGYEVTTFLRTESEVAAIARYEPFEASPLESALALNVGFLDEPLTAEAQGTLMALTTEIDDFHVNGREVYWLCRKKQSQSRFSNGLFERTLKVRATFRGVNTVVRLAAKYPPSPEAG
jgi:uncharacterized protein (DUF1697 family)